MNDPIVAAKALLAGRAKCLAKHSIDCLDGVDQASSAAIEADTHLIRQLQTGGELSAGASLTDRQLTLAQQLGDSAIIQLTFPGADVSTAQPASLLIVRGETGWRIRDISLG